jgi:hypothetical protein
MSIELTEPQQRAMDAESGLPRVVDPRTNAQYLLIPAEDFEVIREALKDDRRQRAVRQVGLRNAAGRMEEEP